MERIAFIFDDAFVYWSAIIVSLAAISAILIYAAMYLYKGGRAFPLSASIFTATLFSIVLARLMHWYCQADAYSSFFSAITDYTQGGYSLMGVFLGCLLSATLLRVLRISDNLPMMLDSMAIGGGVGIVVGRMSALFNATDRGAVVSDSIGLPFASPVVNVVSGIQENRLATFMIQAILVSVIVIGLVWYLLTLAVQHRKIPNGDICLMFLLLYSAVQIVCDSTRYDSMFLRSNRFVSLVQILALVGLVVPLVWFSIRMVMRTGFKLWQIPIWAAILGMMGLAGYMEYFVQRNGHRAVLAYTVMSAALSVIACMGLLIRWISLRHIPKFVEAARRKSTGLSSDISMGEE